MNVRNVVVDISQGNFVAAVSRSVCYHASMVMYQEAPKVGVGIVVVKDGRILLGKRKGSHGAGEWGLPGGKVDPGELPQETAVRELVEEAGLVVDNVRALPWWSADEFPQDGVSFITLYLIADWVSGEAVIQEPEKCEEWRWCDWDAFPQPSFCGINTLAQRWPNLAEIDTFMLPDRD